MYLSELFEVQRKLDAEIEKKHPVLPGEDRLAKRILALQVELGECANEWRGFKFWSANQSPRNLRSKCPAEKADYFFCGVGHEEYSVTEISNRGDYCSEHSTYLMPMRKRNPLLEEYVDCLHFVLSIGLEINFTKYNSIGSFQKPETTENMFLLVNEEITVFSKVRRQNPPIQYVHMYYSTIFESLIALGEMLGFTWKQIEAAYMSKNQINHERQANGY